MDSLNGCFGKYRFETFDEANRVAKAARKRKNAARQEAYRCTSCRGFHIGSNIGSRAARERATALREAH